MSSSFRSIRTPAKWALAAAIAAVAAPAFAESTFDQTVFFGDSLTDSGYYRPLLPAAYQPVDRSPAGKPASRRATGSARRALRRGDAVAGVASPAFG